MRAAIFALTLAAAATLAGCGGGVSVPAQNSGGLPVPPAQQIAYTAIGASDAVGFGATMPCANPPLVAQPTCPGGTGYVPLIANTLTKSGATVTLNDLGISGAVLGPDILAVGNMYGTASGASPCKPRTGGDAIPGDFITNELPNVPATATLVTVFAGGNDTNAIANAAICMTLGGATQQQVASFVTAQVSAFGADLQKLLLGVQSKTQGKAKIVIADVPNFANIPYAAGGIPGIGPLPPAVRALLQQISVTGFDQNVYRTAATQFKVPTVDLLCDPNSYVVSNFYVNDGFHPNDAGYAALAQKFVAQITATTPTQPSFTCAQTAINPSASATLRKLEALPNFNIR